MKYERPPSIAHVKALSLVPNGFFSFDPEKQTIRYHPQMCPCKSCIKERKQSEKFWEHMVSLKDSVVAA